MPEAASTASCSWVTRTTSCALLRKLALQQCAQQFRHRGVPGEGRHLDTGAHRRRHIQCQPGGVEFSLLHGVGIALAYPGFGIGIDRWTSADGNAFAAFFTHGTLRSSSSARTPISRAAMLSGAV